MKKILCLFFLTVGLQLQAGGSKVFEDHNPGSVLQTAANNKRVVYTESGVKVELFHSDYKDGEFYSFGVGRVPLEVLEEEFLSSIIVTQFNLVMENVPELFGDQVTSEIFPIDHEVPLPVDIISFRYRLTDLDTKMVVPIDIHIVASEENALFFVTAISPWMDEEKLTDFSKLLLESIEFEFTIDN